MSQEPTASPGEPPDAIEAASDADADAEDLLARVELLTEENRRLRREYARARRAEYRRTAIGFAAIGAVAAAGGVLFPAVRTVLLALGGTGLFAAVLTYYLTPERFVAATVGQQVYEALATTGESLVAELGLQDTRVYVPLPEPADREAALFVPEHLAYTLPPTDALTDLFVVPDDESRRGVAVAPTGGSLFREFETALAGPLAETPGELAGQLADGVVEQFELADSATPDVDAEGERITVAISGSALGAVDRFDHPVASFLAVGTARGLDEPIELSVTASEDDRHDYLVTCSWGRSAGSNA